MKSTTSCNNKVEFWVLKSLATSEHIFYKILSVMVYITVCQICVFVLQLGQFRVIFIKFCIKKGSRQTIKNPAESGPAGNSWLAIIDRLRTETYEDVINLTGLLDELTTHTT